MKTIHTLFSALNFVTYSKDISVKVNTSFFKDILHCKHYTVISTLPVYDYINILT